MGVVPFSWEGFYSCDCLFVEEKQKKKRSILKSPMKRDVLNLDQTYTVETVVVADSDMVQFHGAEGAQRFLLTVMNMVGNNGGRGGCLNNCAEVENSFSNVGKKF